MRNIAILSGRRRRRFAGAAVAAGPLPDIAWEAGESAPSGTTSTHTRASSAVETDSLGTLVTRGTDVERNTHYTAIAGTRGKLMECQRTNVWVNSNVFTSGWTATRLTPVASAATGPDGVALSASSIFETAVTNTHNVSRSINGGATMAAGTRIPIVLHIKGVGRQYVSIRTSDTNNSVNYSTVFDLTGAGAVFSVGNALAHPNPKISLLLNGFYRVELVFVVQNVTAGTGECKIQGSEDGTEADGYLGDIAKGYYVYGAQQEGVLGANWNSCASSYIATAGSAVTRAADYWYLTLASAPVAAAHSLYTKSTSLEDLVNANGALYVGAFRTAGSSANSSLLLRWDAGQAAAGMIAGVSDYVQLASPLAVQGDVVELLGTIATDGKPTATQKLNGGAEDASAAGAGQAFPANWGGDRIYIGCNPATADGGPISSFHKIALKDGVQTMATMAAL